MASAKSWSLQYILGQLRNDLEVTERKWDNYTQGRIPNSGRDNFLNGIQAYYRLRPTTGRQTFSIGDVAMVHDTLHSHRRYNARSAVEKILDVIVDLRLLRWNVERLLRTLSNSTTTSKGREKLLALQNDSSTWKEVLADKFSLVEQTVPSSPLFSRTLGDVLWRCINSATMIANYLLEAIENQWPANLQLMWRKLASRELHASAALDAASIKPDGKKATLHARGDNGRTRVDAKEFDQLISRKQKILKSMEAEQRRKRPRKSNFSWDNEDDMGSEDLSNEMLDLPPSKDVDPRPDTPMKKGVKVRFDEEASIISTEGNITVHIINQERSESRSSMHQVYPIISSSNNNSYRSPTPQKATYIGSTKETETDNKPKNYMELVKGNNNDNIVVIRRPQMEKQILLPSIAPGAMLRPSTATLRPARVLITEVPEKESSVSTKDLKNMIENIENIDGTVVDINGDMRRELTTLRSSIKQRLRAVQQQIYDFDIAVDKLANTML